jgi:hypothetical protein
MDDGGTEGLFFDVLVKGKWGGGGDRWGVIEWWALVAQGCNGGEMVDDFYFCSKKSVVFLLSNGEEGGKEVTRCR